MTDKEGKHLEIQNKVIKDKTDNYKVTTPYESHIVWITVWIPVKLSHYSVIKEWLNENTQGRWHSSWVPGSSMSHSRKYEFELEQDAVWFTLRWS